MISDGDSSAYNTLAAMNDIRGPYDDNSFKKEECINHASKRLGTRLRKQKKDASTLSYTKSGKIRKKSMLGGKGKLTDCVIDNLQRYYSKALRESIGKGVKYMRNTIMASFYHHSSSDQSPNHKFCPKGKSSWCFFNRAKARREDSPLHSTKSLFLNKLTDESLALIKNVYKDLSATELLQRCQMGWTQNMNESLHSNLWTICPKNKFCRYYRVKFAAQMTILNHNLGYKKSNLMTKIFGYIS